MASASPKFLFLLLILCGLLVATVCAEDWELQFVQVLHRHGDRTPLSPLTPYGDEWICLSTEITQSDVVPDGPVGSRRFRSHYMHGVEALAGNCSLGQLTDLGMSEIAAMAARVKERYADFLPSSYSDETVYIRSDSIDRCQQSSHVFIDTLWPNGSDIVEIEMREAATENLGANPYLCPMVSNYSAAVTSSEEYQQLLGTLSNVKEFFQDLYHNHDKSFPNWLDLNDNIVCRIAHNKSLPPNMTEALTNELLTTWRELFRMINGDPDYAKAAIGQVFNEIMTRIEEKIAGNLGNLLFVEVSGHDTTIWPIIASLQFGNWKEWPPYASELTWELHYSHSLNLWAVRMHYNGEMVTLNGCTEYCPWDEYALQVDRLRLRSLDGGFCQG